MSVKTRLILSLSTITAVFLSVVLPLSLGGNQRQAAPRTLPLSASVIRLIEPPAPTTTVPPPPPKPTTYTVAAGDTLSNIGAHLGVTWEALAGWNHLGNPNVLTVGQVLQLPPAGYVPPPAPVVRVQPTTRAVNPGPPVIRAGIYSFSALESLWIQVGGPSWAAAHAASIAECESGGNPYAHNRSGATGLWQILGAVVPGNLYDPVVNAENAVKKFEDSHNTFAQWVCQ